MIVFKFMHANRNRFDASFVKVIVLIYALIETNLCNSQSQLFRKYCFPKF